jgi:mRNA-degrading endonuclease toxin of MazEF toxin-antitoxin module
MKNFDEWNMLKKEIEEISKFVEFSETEIWWTSIGLNIGDEEDGKNEKYERPVLVIKKFSGKLFVGAPLSTKVKIGKFYVNFKTESFEYSVLLSQAKVMSSKRLIRKINKLSRGRFNLVKKSYIDLINK